MYIMHARNLIHNIPYSQTGYIYNPDTASYGPQAYPPVFPLLLAPLVYFFGVNLLVLKLPGIICFISFLLLLNNKILGEEFPEGYRILLLGLIGFSPIFLRQSESILSDLPFLLFTSISLTWINDLITTETIAPDKWKQDILTGFFIYLSYGSRSIGIVLIPVLLLLFLIRKCKSSRSLAVILLTAGSLIVIQELTIIGTGSYLDQIPGSFSAVITIMLRLLGNYFSLFFNIFEMGSFLVHCLIFLILFEFCVLGILVRIKKGISSYEIFFLLYLTGLLFWPSYQGYRFLIPVIPIYFLFIVEGIFHFTGSIIHSEIPRKIIPLILLCGTGFSYLVSYQEIFPRPVTDMEKPSTQELFTFVRSETGQNDVIVFFKPRVLSLYTDRHSVAIAIPDPEGDPISRMRDFGVDWVIVKRIHLGEFQTEMNDFVDNNPGHFEQVYENDDFRIFRFIEIQKTG